MGGSSRPGSTAGAGEGVGRKGGRGEWSCGWGGGVVVRKRGREMYGGKGEVVLWGGEERSGRGIGREGLSVREGST